MCGITRDKSGGYRHFAPFGARKLQLTWHTLLKCDGLFKTVDPTFYSWWSGAAKLSENDCRTTLSRTWALVVLPPWCCPNSVPFFTKNRRIRNGETKPGTSLEYAKTKKYCEKNAWTGTIFFCLDTGFIWRMNGTIKHSKRSRTLA